jgi:hypothetical protein
VAEQISPTGKSGEPLDRLLEALQGAGWIVDLREPVSKGSGPNPTRVDLRRSRDRRRLLVYSWFITGEGKGRKKNDFRIQTTRTHEEALMTEPGRVTLGIGWDRRRQVFGAFDGWTKRETGSSSSVHIRRALLEAGATDGWAVDAPRWDPRVAFTPANAGKALSWIGEITAERREAALPALEFTREDDETAEIVGDVWRSAPAPWFRKGDRLIAVDKKGLLIDDSLWLVDDLEARHVSTPSSRYNRTHIHFRCTRVGTVHDAKVLEMLR